MENLHYLTPLEMLQSMCDFLMWSRDHTVPVTLIPVSSVYGRQAGVCCSNVEDQDSSSEGGLSSNWWVLGSQGCPLSAPGDATLQTLSQLALSPLGSQSQQPRPETSEHESADKSTERGHCESRESDGEHRNNGEKTEVDVEGREQAEEKEQERKHKRERKHQENEHTSNDEGDLFLCCSSTSFSISCFDPPSLNIVLQLEKCVCIYGGGGGGRFETF